MGCVMSQMTADLIY